jgi:hypothetical protein
MRAVNDVVNDAYAQRNIRSLRCNHRTTAVAE